VTKREVKTNDYQCRLTEHIVIIKCGEQTM